MPKMQFPRSEFCVHRFIFFLSFARTFSTDGSKGPRAKKAKARTSLKCNVCWWARGGSSSSSGDSSMQEPLARQAAAKVHSLSLSPFESVLLSLFANFRGGLKGKTGGNFSLPVLSLSLLFARTMVPSCFALLQKLGSSSSR